MPNSLNAMLNTGQTTCVRAVFSAMSSRNNRKDRAGLRAEDAHCNPTKQRETQKLGWPQGDLSKWQMTTERAPGRDSAQPTVLGMERVNKCTILKHRNRVVDSICQRKGRHDQSYHSVAPNASALEY